MHTRTLINRFKTSTIINKSSEFYINTYCIFLHYACSDYQITISYPLFLYTLLKDTEAIKPNLTQPLNGLCGLLQSVQKKVIRGGVTKPKRSKFSLLPLPLTTTTYYFRLAMQGWGHAGFDPLQKFSIQETLYHLINLGGGGGKIKMVYNQENFINYLNRQISTHLKD